MKSRIVVALLLAGLLAVLVAPQTKPDAEKREPLFFVQIAADVAANVHGKSLYGFVAVYVDAKSWAAGLKDSDLGPFLTVKDAKDGRSAVLLFSDSKDVGICVYFDGDTPFGVAAVHAGANGKIQASDVSAAYKSVTKEMLKKGPEELRFTRGDVSTDDGTPLAAFEIGVIPKTTN